MQFVRDEVEDACKGPGVSVYVYILLCHLLLTLYNVPETISVYLYGILRNERINGTTERTKWTKCLYRKLEFSLDQGTHSDRIILHLTD